MSNRRFVLRKKRPTTKFKIKKFFKTQRRRRAVAKNEFNRRQREHIRNGFTSRSKFLWVFDRRGTQHRLYPKPKKYYGY